MRIGRRAPVRGSLNPINPARSEVSVSTRSTIATLAVAAVGTFALSVPVWADSNVPVATPVVAPADASTPITLATVATHKTASDCWTVIDGKVYNATSFIAGHSGGADVITAMCGIDGTAAFGAAPHGASYFASSQVGVLATGGTTTPTATAAAGLALTDVAKHATATDCWSAINGNVYDLTKFINTHEGGAAVLTAICGIDGTSAFNGQGHPAGYLDQYVTKVGALATGGTTPTATATATSTAMPTAISRLRVLRSPGSDIDTRPVSRERGHFHTIARIGCVHHQATTDVHPDMTDRAVEEDQVTGSQFRSRHPRSR